jgi:phosphoserine phosphatase RsbU/P
LIEEYNVQMSSNELEYLKEKVEQLEKDLQDKNADLLTYESQIAAVNGQLQSLIQEVQKEIKTMGMIQKSLVPVDIPNISGFEFSTKFKPSMVKGGDYFDIFEHKTKFRFGVFLSSSSGYNASSLLLTILFKFGHEIEKLKGRDPHLLIEILKTNLFPAFNEGDRTDLFYGVFDRKKFEMKYVSMGDIYAFYQKSESGEISFIGQENNALTLDFSENIDSKSIVFNPMDRIILCSPGIVQTMNMDGENFGLDRLMQSIKDVPISGSVHDLRNHILFSVEEFGAGQELQRDYTIVVSEVKDHVIKLA